MRFVRRLKQTGFTLPEMLVVLLLVAIFSIGLFTFWDQMTANRRERAIQLEALMLAQNHMERMNAEACGRTNQKVTGQHATYLLRQQVTNVEPGLVWCQVEVEWRGEIDGVPSVIQLGKLFPTDVLPKEEALFPEGDPHLGKSG